MRRTGLAGVVALAAVVAACAERPPPHPRIRAVVGEAALREAIEEAPGPVIVDFWQENCPPCVRQARVLRDLVEEREDLLVLEVSLDDRANAPFVAAGRVRATPTIEVHRGGRQVFARTGFVAAEELRGRLDAAPAPAGE